MNSEFEVHNDDVKNIIQKDDNLPVKKNVIISDKLEVFDENGPYTIDIADTENIEISKVNAVKDNFPNIDRATSPCYKFSMEEFLNNIDNSIDISKINDFEVTEEVINNGQSKSVNCNTLYSSDVLLLSNTVISQDKKKSKEERKKEREKKKEEDLLKKYQIEQEAKHKAIARSKCARWVKFNIKIGEGGYKFVYRGYDVIEAKNVAWCEFKRDHVDTKEKRLVMFKETEIMLKMNHSHIVRCFDVLREWHILEDQQTSLDEKGIVIIQELMGEGTLKNIIKKNFAEGQCILKFPLITRWWHQILDALRYMHQNLDPPIIHRDLKADNCFLYGQTDDEYLNVKVGDFGLATHVHTSGRKTMLGTLGFMAPEIFEEKYDESVDIYAFGMLMLEVMTNRTPYDECETIVQIAAKTLSGKGPKVLEIVGDKWLREIINSCIHPLACYRPTAEELFYHPIFQCKSLRVEVELNYDKVSDRTEVMDRFLTNILNCTKVNLRLRFRDKRMLQELGLDDGESLEFDLDIYKAEDQDIPELIQNLRLEYEDKLSRVYDNPKIQDKRTISSNLDKLFLSLELQMKCLVKHILGRRWRDILDSLVSQKSNKGSDGELESGDDQKGSSNSFAMISEYKGLWTKAKRLLDKEIQTYRENSSKESNVISPTKQVDVKSIFNKGDEPICQELEKVDVDKTIITKGVMPIIVDEPFVGLCQTCENETIGSAILLTGNVVNRNKFQVVTPSTNSNMALDIHDGCRDPTIITNLSDLHTKPAEPIDSETSFKNLPVNHNRHFIRIQMLEYYLPNIMITFVVEIPDMSKPEDGKWVLSFRCVINEFRNLDSFELNTSGIHIDSVDNKVNMVLQETVQCILKLIRINKTIIPIDKNFVFYPKEENIIISEFYPKALMCSRSEASNTIQSSEFYHDSQVESEGLIRPNLVEIGNSYDNMARSTSDNSVSHELIHERIHNYMDALFENEKAIILIKKPESDDKQVIKAHYVPLGTAFVINNDLSIQSVSKTTIISPKVEQSGNVFVRELDKSDLSMDKAINILSLLQEKIEDLSTKEYNKNLSLELSTKVLFESRLNNQVAITEDCIDKQKIIQQILKQKDEIDKLQMQQMQFLAMLENNSRPMPVPAEHDIVNQQKSNNKLYSNQMNFSTESSYLHQYGSQIHFNSNDPRIYNTGNPAMGVFMASEGLEQGRGPPLHTLTGLEAALQQQQQQYPPQAPPLQNYPLYFPRQFPGAVYVPQGEAGLKGEPPVDAQVRIDQVSFGSYLQAGERLPAQMFRDPLTAQKLTEAQRHATIDDVTKEAFINR